MAKDMKQLIREYLQAQKSGTSEDVARINQEARELGQQKKAEREEKKAVKPQVQAQTQTPAPVVPEIPAASVPEEKAAPDLQQIVQDIKEAARKRQSDTRVQAHQARKEYESYRDSEENKAARISEGVGKAATEAEYYSAMAGGTESRKEKELKAKAENLRLKLQTEEDAAVMNRDMAMLEKWPEADRRALETYIAESEQEKYGIAGELNFGKAMTNANDLISKYGFDRVQEMAESLTRYRNARMAKQAEDAGKTAGDGVGAAIGHSLGSLAASTVGAISSPLTQLGDLGLRSGRYSTLDPNSIGTIPQKYSAAAREAVTERIVGEGDSALRKGAGYVYQGAMGAADTAARLIATGGNPAAAMGLAASGSFGQTLSEASEQGASPVQAMGHAGVSATIEALTEKIPLDELMKTAKGGGKGAVQAIAAALKQAGIEATTEEISLLGNLVSEAAILRDKSSYNQRIGDLVANGMSYQEAKKEADRAILQQAKQTAIVSGISGGVSSIGASVGANLSDRLGGRQQTETAAAKTMPEAAIPEQVKEPAPQPEKLSMEQVLRGIAPKKKAPEVPKTEAEQRLDAAIEQTRGIPVQEQTAPVDTAEAAELFPSETPIEKVIENLHNQRENLTKQLYALSEAGNFGAEFQNLSQQWSDISERINELEGEDADRVNSLERAEAPPEREMPEYVPRTAATMENPLRGRTEENVGSRRVKSYQYENPEVKPYFRDAAYGLLSDINSSTPGEKTFNEQLYYESGGEKGWMGTKRHTTDDIADIKDTYGYTWDELREAAEDIIHDRGRENNAASKRLEFLIHDRLANGYTDVEGRPIPANREYLNFLEERQVNDYRRESMDDLMDHAGRYAPQDGPEGFEAMGAASYGFNPFTRMQNEYGNIPDGENAVRPDDMPVSTNGSDRVSYTARTVKGAAATPEEFIGDLENLVVKGGMSYIPISNDATAQAAAESIRRLGWDESLAEWRAKVRSGKAGPDMTATGAILLNNAANAGDKQTWLRILDDYRRLGTNTAQGLQAFRILKKLQPEDKLYLIRRSVNQMVEDMHLDTDIAVDDDLAKAYQEAKTDEEADEILSQIQKDVAAQIPSTAMDKWTALRYVNMLGNLRTQVRNIAGNIGAQSAYRVKDSIAAVIEAAASRASGGKFERTKSVTVNRKLKKAAAKDFDAMKGAVLDGGKYTDNASESSDFIRGVMDQRTIFKSDNKAVNAMLKPMEGYRRATNWAMNNDAFGDAAFGRAAYARAMAGYLQANGVKGDSLDNVDAKLLDKARSYAAKEAQEATFRDNNAVSDWISRIGRRKDTPKAAKVIAEGIMPFRKTPANVLVRAEEFSPLGVINATVKSVQAAKGGEVTGADVVNSWAKALTGTGLTILGAALGNAGLLIGGPDTDEDEAAFDDLNGYQNYAIQLPDGTNLTIDFLSPVAMPLFLGAQLAKLCTEEGDYQLADLESVFLSLADPMIQMSMLQGVNDTLENIKYSENNMGQFLLNAMTSYLTQGITNTLMGQMERASEDERMTTYVDKDSQLSPWVQRQLGKISQKIPGVDYQQIPYRNAWGETEENPEGAWDYLYNLLSPSYISRGETDALAAELKRLNGVQSDINVFPDSPETTLTYTDKEGNVHEDYHLSAEQWQVMAETEGKTQNRIAKALTESADYAALTDEQKAKAISLCYEYAREKGRKAAIEGYTNSDSWMEGIEGSETTAIVKKVALAGIDDAISTLKEAWRKDYDTAGLMQNLEGAYTAYTGLSNEMQKSVLEDASSSVQAYIQAREDGTSTEKYAKIQMPALLLGDGMDDLSEAIKEGADTSAALSELEETYKLYSKLGVADRQTVMEKVSTKTEYYLDARAANVSTKTFAQLYKTFTEIGNTDAGEFDKAEDWAHALQKAKEARQINQTQVDALKDSMRFWQIIPAKAKEYNKLVDNGVAADTANKVMDLLDGITGTGSINKETEKPTVRDVDKWEALAEALFLSESEKDNAIKLYMPDYDPTAKEPNKTELKYDYARQEWGITAEDYMDAYRASIDNGKKDEKIAAWKALGFSDAEANNFYRLFDASGKNKIDVVQWYESQ